MGGEEREREAGAGLDLRQGEEASRECGSFGSRGTLSGTDLSGALKGPDVGRQREALEGGERGITLAPAESGIWIWIRT